MLTVVSDLTNVILWVFSNGKVSEQFAYILKDIRALSSLIMVVFKHVLRSNNEFVVSLAKNGSNGDNPFVDIQFVFFSVVSCLFNSSSRYSSIKENICLRGLLA